MSLKANFDISYRFCAPAGLPLEPPCANHAWIGTKQAKGLNA